MTWRRTVSGRAKPSTRVATAFAILTLTATFGLGGCGTEFSTGSRATTLPPDTYASEPDRRRALPARRTGYVQVDALREVSGIAVSTRDPTRLWMHADSGSTAALYAVDREGRSLARYAVAADARDWEDIAAVRVDGIDWLLVGDIGDNLRRRDDTSILAIREPTVTSDRGRRLRPIRMRFRYPDAPHDAEALASDGRRVWLLTKAPWGGNGRQPSRVWSLPLPWTVRADEIVTARDEGVLGLPRPDAETRLVGALTGVDIAQPTAFAIAPDGRTAYTLSYRSIHRYRRTFGERWPEALARPGQRLHVHDLRQAEALDVDPDGVLWFSSEAARPPLWALPTGQLK